MFCLVANNCCVSSGSDGLAKALKSMEKGIALPYHEALDQTVKQLDGKSLPRTFTLHEAFVDSALAQRAMPAELRYLPYALSGMRADYSQGDRCGYWALPTLVGLRYGLQIDERRDERLSVEASTLAALDYLDDLNKKYGDWWLSILAYANSPTALSHAMARHEATPALWDYYDPRLLPDTEVIRRFIACVYLGNQGRLSFSARAVEPSVVKAVEPVVTPTPATTGPSTSPASPKASANSSVPKASASPESVKYKVKKGDTLLGIAARYHISVANLKQWNNLKTDNIQIGQTLTIKKQ